MTRSVALALGGKAPLGIQTDANLEEAVNTSAFGRFANSGRIGLRTERITVDRKIADAFVKKFADKAKALR